MARRLKDPLDTKRPVRGEERAAEPKVAIDTLVDMLEERFQRWHDEEETAQWPSHGHLPATPTEAFAEPNVLESVLSDYSVDEATSARVKQCGIYTMEQLRAVVTMGDFRRGSGPVFAGRRIRRSESSSD